MSIPMQLRFAAVLLTVSMGPVVAAAQTQLEQPGGSGRSNHTITGTVLNSVTNEPIQRALVRIDGPMHAVVFTGSDGRFSAAQVPEGPVYISAQRPGFNSGGAPGGMPGSPSQFTVTSGSNDFQIPLVPDCTLEGVILDSDGEPVEGVNVQVLAQQIWRGHKNWAPRSGAVSDETGAYEIPALPAGAVIVATLMKPLMANGGVNGPPLAYPALYYPGGPDRASAQPVVLQPGQTARANFSLRLSPTHRVSGVVSGMPPGTGVFVQVDVDPESGGGSFVPAMVDQRTGRFTLPNVPDGDFTFLFNGQAASPDGIMLSAELRVAVSGADVYGLTVRMQSPPLIQVHANRPSVAAQSEPPQTPAMMPGTFIGGGGVGASVQLFPFGSDRIQGYSAMPQQPAAPGASTDEVIQGVIPGEYAVVVQSQSAGGFCVDSVTSGGADLTRQPLNVVENSAPQPITVNLRSDCASVAVKLRSEDRRANGTVIVMSDSLNFEPNVVTVPVGSEFQFGGLTPGTYRFYAFDDASDLEYANPEAMREYKATEVTVAPNQKASVSLELNRRIEK